VAAIRKMIIKIMIVAATKKTIINITSVTAMKKELNMINVVGINIEMITNGGDVVETG